MIIQDYETGAGVLPEVLEDSLLFADAAAAYSAWAAEMGVSSTATLSDINSVYSGLTIQNDTFLLDLGFPVLLNGLENKIAFCGGGGIALYKRSLEQANSYYAQTGSYKKGSTNPYEWPPTFPEDILDGVYAYTDPSPSLLISTRPAAGRQACWNAKWQKSANAAIIFFNSGALNSPTPHTATAIRFRPGGIDIVVTPLAAAGQRVFLSRLNYYWGYLDFNLMDGYMVASGFTSSTFLSTTVTTPKQIGWQGTKFGSAVASDGFIRDSATGVVILPELQLKASPYADAAAAYAAWAAEIGVSSTSTISDINGVWETFVLDLGFPTLLASPETRIGLSTESGVSFFKDSLVGPDSFYDLYGGFGSSDIYYPAGSVEWMSAPGWPQPSLILSIKPLSQSSATTNGKWQKSGENAILFYNAADWEAANPETAIAIRFRPGYVEVVATPLAQTDQKIVLAQILDSGDGPEVVSTVTLAENLTGTTYIKTKSMIVVGNAVDGWMATKFGTATIPAGVTEVAEGWAATAVFGVPRTGAIAVQAEGFEVTQIGYHALNTDYSYFDVRMGTSYTPPAPLVFTLSAETPTSYATGQVFTTFGTPAGAEDISLELIMTDGYAPLSQLDLTIEALVYLPSRPTWHTDLATFGQPRGDRGRPLAKFGAPAARAVNRCGLTGWTHGFFGTGRRVNFAQASTIGQVTQIPQAYRTFNQWEYAASDVVTIMGWPSSVKWAPPGERRLSAASLIAYRPGLPTALPQGFEGAQGWSVTAQGTPTARLTVTAQDLDAHPSFGSVSARQITTARGGGIRSTAFGAATSARLQPATSAYRPTRWGKPKSDILGTCKVRGLYTVRWAQPAAKTGNFRLAVGVTATGFGTPDGSSAFRAVHIAPTVRYGRHLLRRNTTC